MTSKQIEGAVIWYSSHVPSHDVKEATKVMRGITSALDIMPGEVKDVEVDVIDRGTFQETYKGLDNIKHFAYSLS